MSTPRTLHGVVAHLALSSWKLNLRSLYDDAEPETKHRIAQALFEKVEVLGPTQVWLHPSVEAEERGWAAVMSGEFQLELRQIGRGERSQTDPGDLNVPLPLSCEVLGRHRWTRAAAG
jgi:hypothetical protein